jgi:hypothetical protein
MGPGQPPLPFPAAPSPNPSLKIDDPKCQAGQRCPLANINGLNKNFGLRNVNVYVKMIELRVHMKSNLFTTNDC